MYSSPKDELSRKEFICIIAALMALNSLAIDIMLPALPYMGEAFGIIEENSQQFIISAYMIGYGLGEIFFGPVSDRFGRKWPLILGVTIYSLSTLFAVFSPSFTILLLLRFIQGIGAASTRVVATSVVRDRYSGNAMAEIMSLVIMLFMVIPILAPGVGQLLLITGPWESIFYAMTVFGVLVGIWVFYRLPETLSPAHRRALTCKSVVEGFRIVVSNRSAFFYGLAGMFLFASLFGFLTLAQQIYVGIYHLDEYFPIAFASVAALMGIASYTNSKLVRFMGMRLLSHLANIILILTSGLLASLSSRGSVDFELFYPLLAITMSCFSWAAANMNSLSMEPLGDVAGTASSAFGFIQTVGGVLIGGFIGQQFDGTILLVSVGYFSMGFASFICILVAEKGRLFGSDFNPLVDRY